MFPTNKPLSKTLKLSGIYFGVILGIPILFFSLILFYFFFFPQKEVELFPLADPKGIYSITHDDGLYTVTYTGTRASIVDRAYILESSVDLKPYINKNILIQGDFISSNTQCIVQLCKKLSTHWVGLKIKSITIDKRK
ncbi:hypothetical protein BH09PAT2_BH09PAT2_04470 [soil metagenome]